MNNIVYMMIIAGIIIRFLLTISAKMTQFKKYSFKKYFDKIHIIRWSLHIIMSFIATFFLNKYFAGYEEMAALGAGFAGYDLTKLVEKLTFSTIKKATGVDVKNEDLL